MKPRFVLFRRGKVFYCEDTQTKAQVSLRTKDEGEALTLLHAKNEAFRQPFLNLQLARTYLSASDPEVARRSWAVVMEEMAKTKSGVTLHRHTCAMKDKAFDLIRDLPILESQASHFLRVLQAGSVSTNVFLRRLQNFALGMNWLPWPILPKKQWPEIAFKEKRAITSEEHRAIVAIEHNSERRAFYECCWLLGASQSDVAELQAEDVDWKNRIVCFTRKKTGTTCIVRFGGELEECLKASPRSGPLFPNHRNLRETHRAREFARCCKRANVKGVSLHSYRYAWAERARTCGYPERFAQEALGHQSKAVHRAYSRKAKVIIPSLEEYEGRAEAAEITATLNSMAS